MGRAGAGAAAAGAARHRPDLDRGRPARAARTLGNRPGDRGGHRAARARDAIASGALDEASVWLARWACADLPPLPAIDAALEVPPSAAAAVQLAAPALRAWLEQIGLDQLAFGLGPHAAALAAVFGDRLLVAVDRITRPPRAGQLGARRGAIERARGDHDPLALIRIGARALAPHAARLVRRQLAVRLPRPLGLVVFAELAAHAAASREHGPTWQALAAP